ncbi:MAG: alpha/beta hydrolase [Gammaproteobacteria bacterium]
MSEPRRMTLAGVVASLAAAYGLLCAALYLLQDRMLFLPGIPGREITATPAALNLRFEELAITTADGLRLHGWWVPAEGARRTLLHFHGNAGNISHRLELLEIWHALGLNVVLFDYRGYGASDGSPSEEGLYRDAEAVWAALMARGVRANDVVIHGQSMGGAVAAWLAARRQPAALVLESAFTSVPEVAAGLYPWLPVRLLARLRLDTRGELARVRAPVLVIHSRDDEIIPFAHGEALLAAAQGSKQLIELRGDHNGGFYISREAYERGWRDFLTGIPRGP